jgi:hypothetical protein
LTLEECQTLLASAPARTFGKWGRKSKGQNGKGTPKGPAAKAASATDPPETAAVRAKPTRLAAKGAKASADKKAPADLTASRPKAATAKRKAKAKKSSAKKT